MREEKGFGQSDPDIVAYAMDLFQPEDEVLARTREMAESHGLPPIQVGAFDVRHLEVLVRMTNAKKAVEIGTLGGYSGIAIARALGAGGKLHSFELEPKHAEVARNAFEKAQLAAVVVVHVGPALENLPSIEKEGPFDVVFIDADKLNYLRYLEWAMNHLRVGGVAIADNTFAFGEIHRASGVEPKREKIVNALREYNRAVATSARFRATILPTAEGLTVAVKIS